MKWEIDNRGRARTTERDGLRFEIRHDHYGNSLAVSIYRASDREFIETITVSQHAEETAIELADTWSLEVWRANMEAKYLREADRALSDHRNAMTALNRVRNFRV